MYRKTLEILTKCEGEVVNITTGVEKILHESGVLNGLIHIFVTGQQSQSPPSSTRMAFSRISGGPCRSLHLTLFHTLIIPGGGMGTGDHM